MRLTHVVSTKSSLGVPGHLHLPVGLLLHETSRCRAEIEMVRRNPSAKAMYRKRIIENKSLFTGCDGGMKRDREYNDVRRRTNSHFVEDWYLLVLQLHLLLAHSESARRPTDAMLHCATEPRGWIDGMYVVCCT